MSGDGERSVVIIGAGPAGLTAAYELCKAGDAPVVLEQDEIVGGLAKTINYKGFRFDIGGHRFYTKVETADRIWREVLPAHDFLRRKRLSRIYYNKKFFHYPLRASSMLLQLGVWQGCLILLSYFRARLFPEKSERTFEQWITNRFGKRLYTIFFKSYTEKVWGIPCGEITAEWAAQRIKGLSLATVLKDLLIRQPRNDKTAVVKTLINEFDYPRYGPSMMWETMAALVRSKGGKIRLGSRVENIHWTQAGIEALEISRAGRRETLSGTHFISSMPIRELVRCALFRLQQFRRAFGTFSRARRIRRKLHHIRGSRGLRPLARARFAHDLRARGFDLSRARPDPAQPLASALRLRARGASLSSRAADARGRALPAGLHFLFEAAARICFARAKTSRATHDDAAHLVAVGERGGIFLRAFSVEARKRAGAN